MHAVYNQRFFFDRLCLIDPVFLIFRWKKHTVNRKESTSVRPSKREHTETKFISVSGMVIYFCKKFRFFERLRSNIELSMINTLARSCESSGRIASLMILPARMVVKRIQLIWTIFIKRYTVSLAKARVFLHEIRFLYASV